MLKSAWAFTQNTVVTFQLCHTHLYVCVCALHTSGRRWPEPETTQPKLKCSPSQHHWTWDVTTESPLTGMDYVAPSVVTQLSELLQKGSSYRARAELDFRSVCTLHSLVNVNSGVGIVRRCFSDGGNSKHFFLGALVSEPVELLMSLSD